MIQKFYTQSRSFLLILSILAVSTTAFAQQLGIYQFTGHTCAVPATAVTAQPANAVFSNYARVGATCTAATDVFNTTGWAVGATLDPSKYMEFTITPNACTVMNLDSLKFLHRVSTSGGALTVVIRSSLDGYVSDVYNAPISAVNVNVNLAIDLPASFNGLTSAVTFRTYLVNILSATATYRHDNVALVGTAINYPLANYYADADGDGFGNAAVFVNTCTPPVGYVSTSNDCDDNNSAIGSGIVFYQDSDNDGFGNPAVTLIQCTQPVGYVSNSNDCNDNNNAIGLPTTTYYADADGDSYGNPAVTTTACTQPVGYVTNSNDCDDNNNAIGVATTVYYADADGDTYGNGSVTTIACTQPGGYVTNGNDCDDSNNAIHPGATETCDGIDNDCFGGIDDNVVNQTWYADTDGDGFGNASTSVVNCAQPVGYVSNNTDCDDNNSAIGIASTTYYADADGDTFGDAAASVVACTAPVGYVANNTDCDDSNNTIGVAQSWYPDTDNDGYGSAAATAVVACTAPANHVLDHTDCNDANAAAHPGGTEIPDNGVDEDCNGSDLNTLGTQLAQYTFTGNSCTNPVHSVTAQPAHATFSDYSADSVLCSLGNDIFNYAGWNMGTTIDTTEYYQFTITPDHCYELSLSSLTFLHRVSNSGGTPFVHVRSSLDNFATDIFSTQIAAPGTNYTENVTLPAAFASITDSVSFRFYVVGIASAAATYRNDNVSVTGFINALPQQTYYADADGDSFGDPAVSVTDCAAPQGYVMDNTDCNDNNASENPNSVWFADTDADGFGNAAQSLAQCTQPVGYVSDNTDCNDNSNAIGGSIIYYADTDNDGFGDAGSSTAACTPPAGYVTDSTDCDDTDNTITVATDQFYIDADGDGFGADVAPIVACTQPAGYASNNGDCDDNNSAVGLPANTYFLDTDNDGFGDAANTTIACTAPNGYVSNSTDCDDNNTAINPNATDINGNSIDENCDGVDGNLGINEFDHAAVIVFPNPGSAVVNVHVTGSWNGTVAVTIRSIDGKTVQTGTLVLNNGTAELSTTELLPSVYFIQVTDGAHKAIVRWVKN